MEAMNITDAKRMKALLLHLAGEQTYDVYEGLVVQAVAEDVDPAVDVYLATKRALDTHYSPKKNVEFEIYNVRLAKQRAREMIDDYHARLRAPSKYCEFADVDKELKSHNIQSCTSSRLRRRALAEPNMTLKERVDVGRSDEAAERQVKTIEGGQNSTVAAVQYDR